MTLPAPNPTPAIATALAKIGLALKTQGQRSADELGLSPLQAQALSILHGHHEPLRGSELADELAVKRATTSVAVRALVEKGLVNRRADAEDGRATRLSLTAKGTRIASSLDAWPELIREGVHDLNAQERAAFLVLLIKMIRSLQERGHIPLARMCTSCVHFRPDAHPGKRAPHHCAFIDAPLRVTDLRVDCQEHEEEPSQRTQDMRWQAFLTSAS